MLSLQSISKQYPGVLANDRVSLSLDRGEVLGVLGENGAGKSTLMNIVSGLIGPDSGEIAIDGEPVSFASPRDAIARGIGMVHQHFMLVPTLSVVENVVLGDHRIRTGHLDLDAPSQRIRELGERISLPVDPSAEVGTLDVGGQQRVEIIKALYRDARILILDEPTAVLSRPESAGLFAMIQSLSRDGVSVILISHKLDDIFEVCDRVVVMRMGQIVGERVIGEPAANDAVVGEHVVAETNREDLIRMMVGEDLTPPQRDAHAAGAVLVEVADVVLLRDNGAVVLEGASFELRSGEILGLAGVEGNGQRELVEAICGLRDPARGAIERHVNGRGNTTVRRLRRAGIRHVPENRHESGVLAGMPLTENMLLSHFFAPLFNRLGWLKRGTARASLAQMIDTFDIRTAGPQIAIDTLSGGNQQKLVLARELAGNPSVLIAAHPTRGLDVRTIAFVHTQLLERRAQGMGILLVSSDLAEIWQVADRVMVAAGGQIKGPVPIAEIDIQQVGAWMAGG